MAERLKDIYFTRESINNLADAVQQYYAQFDRENFLELIYDGGWQERALKDKMRHTAVCLHAVLPDSYAEALQILRQVVPSIKGFEALAFPEYVALYGMLNWDLSLSALGYFTKFGSAEFAIRTFLVRDAHRAMAYMYRWAEDEDAQVRRLSSEGCQPRLPWGIALPAFQVDPTPILPILEKLKDDGAETVRRSVSNNLNDISKDHPELVLDICQRWYGESKKTDWIVKHACRSLLKAGNPRAMNLFGFSDPRDIHVEDLRVDKEETNIGGEVNITFALLVGDGETRKLRLEYAVDFVKARGKISRKVFHIKEVSLTPGSYPITRKHSFVNRSTRVHYPGRHQITIIVNGVEKGSLFILLEGC